MRITQVIGSAALVVILVVSGCGGDSGSGARAGDPNSSELFDRSYGYLLRGDPDFTRYAPNYSTLRPFTRDTAMSVELKSEAEGVTSPQTGYLESFQVHIHRPMTMRMIVADSSGNGLITFEFANLANGSYTLGTKGWPNPQREITKGNPFVYVYFVGDQRFRMRYKLGLDEKHNLTYMPQPPTTG